MLIIVPWQLAAEGFHERSDLMAFFLAVDAGGTKTDYVLADDTRTLARVRSGTIKRLRVDAAVAEAQLGTALDQLATQSGVSLSKVSRCCVGTAGNTVPLVVDWLRAEFSKRVGGELVVMGDVEIALDAAFHGGPGVLVLSGTGSNVAGRAEDGVILTAGGWGPLLADQASGHRIGQEALRAAFLAIDEERETTLLASMMEFWQLDRLEQLIEYANSSPAPDLSRLAPIVARCAADGDGIAVQVLETQGKELGYVVRHLIRRLRQRDSSFVPEIAFAGSVMERLDAVRESLLAEVRREFHASARDGCVDPIEGALRRARQGKTS